MDKEFDGRVALVTGAGKGLGRAYALWLAARGCAVVVNNRIRPGVAPSAAAVVEEIIAKGGKARVDEHSVEDESGAGEMVARAIDEFGRLDILICNAGVATRLPFAGSTIAELKRVIDTNLWGTLYPLSAAWPHLVAAKFGRIVLTGSSVGLYGHPDSAAYGASKAAMIGLARSLAREVPSGADIRINVIAPFAYTPMSADQIDATYADHLSPDRVAPIVGWLASVACRESGMILHAGGGRVSRVRFLETAGIDIPPTGFDGCLEKLTTIIDRPEASTAAQAGARLGRG